MKNWKGETVVIIASGPSLTAEDVDYVRFEKPTVKTITINESWRRHPMADVLYGADPQWWVLRSPRFTQCNSDRWTQNKHWNPDDARSRGLNVIRSEYGADVSTDPGFIYQGNNSSFQAMNLAVLWGAKKIVFLGLDCQGGPSGETHWHWYPDKFQRNKPGWGLFRQSFENAAPKLRELDIGVINASRQTAVKCFPQMDIKDALEE